jgi:(p)ppGpp synthase/HD superfamily hydrolase
MQELARLGAVHRASVGAKLVPAHQHSVLVPKPAMPTTWSQDLYIRAYRFAAQAHRWQRVPGTSLPYIMHLSFAAMEILAVAAVEDLGDANVAVQCALLHDTLEDTRVRYEQLQADFGQAVADGVLALTLNKKLPKSSQMTECLGRIKVQPRQIWMVKMADRITNLQPPPPHWSLDRIQDYHREAQVILEALGSASPFLAERLRLKISEYAAYAARQGLLH